MDEPTLNRAYTAPVATPARAVSLAALFREPRAIAGSLLLVHCLLIGLIVLARYLWAGQAPGWNFLALNSGRAVLGIGLIVSERRFLPPLVLALLAAHAGYPLLFAHGYDSQGHGRIEALKAGAVFGLLELLPYVLLLLGRAERFRRRLALVTFGVAELVMMGGSVAMIVTQVHLQARYGPAARPLSGGSGARP